MIKFFAVLAAAVATTFIVVTGAKADVKIVVDVSQQTMYVATPESVYEMPVSTARTGYHTPRGSYQPIRLERMHYSSKYDNAPMPNSIFFNGGYAIHATYDVKRLGRPASHGCIRLSPNDAAWLFDVVRENGSDNTYIQLVD